MKKSAYFIYTSLFLSGCSNIIDGNVERISIADITSKPNTSDVSNISDIANTQSKKRTYPEQINKSKSQPLSMKDSAKSEQTFLSNSFKEIIESALAYNTKTSPLPLTIQQREAELDAIQKGRWPTIQPSVRWMSNSSPYIGLEASYTLFDFGASSHKEKQGDIAIAVSQVDFYLEQRGIIADVITELAAITALKEKIALTSQLLKSLGELSRFAAIRVEAGFINESEPLILNLRIAELNSEIDAMEVELALKTKLLSAKLMEPISVKSVPSFLAMNSSLVETMSPESLQMKKAQLAVELAQAKLKQTESERFPQINVQGGIGLTTNSTTKNHSIGVVLNSPVSLFVGGANVNAAGAALEAAVQEANQTQVKLNTELERIALEKARLFNNRNMLKRLEHESELSVELFKSQFEAATATISDGLSVHQTLLKTRQQLVDLEAELLNLKASEIRISDGQFLK